MATTAQGAIELRNKVDEIKLQAKAVANAATALYRAADQVSDKLALRISDGEAPRGDKIAGLQGQLAAAKTNISNLTNAISVPSVQDFTNLAETPDP